MNRTHSSTLARRAGTAPVTRYAPSPTGFLHLGHLVNAIYVWGIARALQGTVLLRIEDHDRIRSRPEFDRALLDDLGWLGFVSPACLDGGGAGAPRPVGDTLFVGRQSTEDEVYWKALQQLRQTHHVYACDCSRTDVGPGPYTGRCRARRVEERPGVGLRVELAPGDETFDDLRWGHVTQTPSAQCGDMLLRDRDGHWTYQFAVVVDDLRQGVTLVIRGEDLLSSTGRQRRLARMLMDSGASPSRPLPRYLHHPLIMGPDGRKLSKSAGADGVRVMRHRGVSPAEVIGAAAAAVGLAADGSRVTAAEVEFVVARAFEAGPLTSEERIPDES